jgi:hypothetical protein
LAPFNPETTRNRSNLVEKIESRKFHKEFKRKKWTSNKKIKILGVGPILTPLHLGNDKSHLKIHALSPLGLLFLMCISD